MRFSVCTALLLPYSRTFSGRHINYPRCKNDVALSATLPGATFTNTGDEQLVEDVIMSQPAVLLLAKKGGPAFSHWKGTRLQLDEKCLPRPKMIPFVDREETVLAMTDAIISNLDRAQDIQSGSFHEERSLCLVGSGALFGAGKTRIGSVVKQCVERVLPKDKTVVYALSKVDTEKSTYNMWVTDICTQPGMKGLRTIISADMFTAELIMATESYLSERNMVLFLHLDEFAPFNDAGRTANNTQVEFYQCWRLMLIPILSSPSIALYISGRIPYYDTIGRGQYQSPCAALSVQLDLFSADIIHTALNKTSIPLYASTEDTTLLLSEALDHMFSPMQRTQMQQQQWSREIAQRLHDVTGGVPRFVEYALHALLVSSEIHTTLFARDGRVHSAALLDTLFSKGGAVYNAVTTVADTHFGAAVEGLAKNGAKRIAGLLQLVFLRERAFRLSPLDVKHIAEARFSLDGSPIAQLISHAQFWGIHRNFNKHTRLVSFAVPPAVLDGLAPVLAKWRKQLLLPDFADDNRDPDPLGTKSEQKVFTIIAFHRLLADLLLHSNWLGLEEDYSEGPITLLNVDTAPFTHGATSEPSTLTSRAWDLPCLPIVSSDGRLKDIDAVGRSITYGDSNASNPRKDSALDVENDGSPERTDVVKGKYAEGKEAKTKQRAAEVKAAKAISKAKKAQAKAEEADKKGKCRPELLGQYLSGLPLTGFHAFSTGPRSSSADFIVRYGGNATHVQVKNTGALSFLTILEECGKVAPTVKASLELRHTLALLMMNPGARAESVKMIRAQKLENALKETLSK